MPGPRSAPNGDRKLVDRRDASTKTVVTGKTALKRGTLKERKEITDSVRRLSRARREEQEQT